MLNGKQQVVFDYFLEKIEERKSCFLSSENRGIGKTFTLNELAFNLQALGYIVYILTPYKNQEYFAHSFISDSMKELYKIDRDILVIIVDESKYCKLDEIINFCKDYQIPIVGYVDFEFGKIKIKEKIEFKREYDCKWIINELEDLLGNTKYPPTIK